MISYTRTLAVSLGFPGSGLFCLRQKARPTLNNEARVIEGDPDSIVVDAVGRISGLLTGSGGASDSDSTDVTYVTLLKFVMKTIQTASPSPRPTQVESA
jgi:hypothetical protein